MRSKQHSAGSTCPCWPGAVGEKSVLKSQLALAHFVPEQRAARAVLEGLRQDACFTSNLDLAKLAAFMFFVPVPERHCDYRTDIKSQNHCQNLK